MIVVASATSYCVIVLPNVRIIPIALGIFGYTYGSLLGIFFCGMLTKRRGTDWANPLAMICGFLFVALISNLPNDIARIFSARPLRPAEVAADHGIPLVDLLRHDRHLWRRRPFPHAAARTTGEPGTVSARETFQHLLAQPEPILALAPMQDVTDLPFMRLISGYGNADVYFTEYFRVLPDSRLDRNILASITENPTGRPVIAQMIGNDIAALVRTARELQQHPVAAIDLNLGCPAPVVYRKCAGGGLLREPQRIDRNPRRIARRDQRSRSR